MFTYNAITTIRMCCRMFTPRAFLYGQVHSSCMWCTEV